MLRLMILPATALVLAACQPGTAEMSDAPDACGATALASLVGTAAAAHDFSDPDRPHRVIPPNAAVTMDHRPDRLNVDVDADGVITRLWCG